METLSQLLLEHLKFRNCFNTNPAWVIKSSNLSGRGLFAKRDIKPGETIFKDSPLLIGPRAKPTDVTCVNCYKKSNLHPCSQKCGLPVCSEKCEKSHKKECQVITHWLQGQEFCEVRRELLTCLTPIRALLLNDQQSDLLKSLAVNKGPKYGFEVNILKHNLNMEVSERQENMINFASSALDTNAFEVIVGDAENSFSIRGIYPLSSLLNHSCVPNTRYDFDINQNMIVKATIFIPKDQEIFHCYTKLLWGTCVRQSYLMRTKQFFCSCCRCQDLTEFGTNLSAINCLKCRGLVLPVFVKNMKMAWKCTSCNEGISAEKAGIILTMLGNRLDSFESCEPEEILDFMKGSMLKYAPDCSQIAVQLKCKLVWILGWIQNYLWGDLSMDLLNEKEKICRELLQLLSKLGVGKSKMRGLLLYELYCCLRERHTRFNLYKVDEKHDSIFEDEAREMEELFQESREILTDDVHAPAEIKQYNLLHDEKPIHNIDVILAG